jgi:hypothetical protein
MSATATEYLSEIKSGDILVYNIVSQAMYTGSIILRDDSEIYFTAEKPGTSTSPTLLGQGFCIHGGGQNLRIEIKVNEAVQGRMSISETAEPVRKDDGAIVGYIYDYCVEDGCDNDFNDFYINIAAWHQKG